MTLKVVWGITGSGDKMPETVAAMAEARERLDLEITAAVSIAGGAGAALVQADARRSTRSRSR